jgi:hypothetical protein
MRILKDAEGNEYFEHPDPNVITVLPGDTFDFDWKGQKMRVCGYAAVDTQRGIVWYPPNNFMQLDSWVTAITVVL